jgi:hypothetical protein
MALASLSRIANAQLSLVADASLSTFSYKRSEIRGRISFLLSSPGDSPRIIMRPHTLKHGDEFAMNFRE